MRLLLAIFLASLASASAKQCPAAAIDDATSYPRPNIVFVVTDESTSRPPFCLKSEA